MSVKLRGDSKIMRKHHDNANLAILDSSRRGVITSCEGTVMNLEFLRIFGTPLEVGTIFVSNNLALWWQVEWKNTKSAAVSDEKAKVDARLDKLTRRLDEIATMASMCTCRKVKAI